MSSAGIESIYNQPITTPLYDDAHYDVVWAVPSPRCMAM